MGLGGVGITCLVPRSHTVFIASTVAFLYCCMRSANEGMLLCICYICKLHSSIINSLSTRLSCIYSHMKDGEPEWIKPKSSTGNYTKKQ